ncbi:hypothetical protein BDV36DRAFT_273158 [Aspergillus pseudocaelatus]|uniref:Uncharacterized protein n=1 Tax=Aspergillus pseudocaelatus TaxID=1825620 RepID=A0ABQ6W432_9EURO|nr:hypothetical protein BDV36DRAFT_273158 [Aspergillus pseudocaelatus]
MKYTEWIHAAPLLWARRNTFYTVVWACIPSNSVLCCIVQLLSLPHLLVGVQGTSGEFFIVLVLCKRIHPSQHDYKELGIMCCVVIFVALSTQKFGS